MTDRHLHIVCLDVPYPVDYGGVFDLFYKIKALSEEGIKIHLHCYQYGRPQAAALSELCEEVHYYERTPPLRTVTEKLPYIVASRSSNELLKRLNANDYPVLMEGIHCTYFVHSGQLPAERSFVRLHNVEHQYYRQLKETSPSFLKRLYFDRESKLLYDYEKELAGKATFWTVSEADLDYFNSHLAYQSVDFLPLFLPEFESFQPEGCGNFCLYHGNLSVAENEFAASWLLQEVFADLELPFVIAGKSPSDKLEKLAHKKNHTCLVANPLEKEMQELIRMAQVHVLPSFNNTGIKLKLVNALHMGRHCVVNEAGVAGTGLETCVTIANSRDDMKTAIAQAFSQPFDGQAFADRQQVLHALFNNQRNARQMINWIFGGEPTRPGLRPRH